MSARRPEFARFFFHRWMNSPQIARMPFDAQGLVVQLMCKAYADEDCAIPDDDDLLAKWAYLSRSEWDASALRRHVRSYFLPIADAPGKLANEKQRELYLADVEAMNRASDIGKSGALKRWGSRMNSDGDAKAMPRHMPEQCVGNANPNAKEGRKEGKNTTPSRGSAGEPEGFAEFYAAYPRKVGRPDAARSFKTAIGKSDLATIMAGLARWKASDQWRTATKKQIAYPATWLNQERWNDFPDGEDTPEPEPFAAENDPDFLSDIVVLDPIMEAARKRATG